MIKKSIAGLAVCLFLLVTNAWAQGLPDTGQTKCYNNIEEIPCPQPGEAFYGQDAEYVKARSYTDLGKGIVRDNVTGLEWQQATAPDTYTWQQAVDYCANLKLGPYSDWRLPTIKELSTLVDSDIPWPDPTINTTYFPDTAAGYYWSSTPFKNHEFIAWYVIFYGGYVDSNSKTGSYYVRAVRGNPLPANNFIDNADGTITDTATGLMWQQATAPGTYTWRQALDYVAQLNTDEYLGHDDWRLPDRTELQSIVDYSRYNPAIDPVFSAEAFLYWSSTTDAYETSSAWSVWFSYGYVHSYGSSYYKSSYNYVRAVRGGTRIPPDKIDKCTVKAGKINGTDRIKFSGLLNATEADFNAAIGDNIIITIEADDIPNLDVTTYSFPVTAASFTKGKYKAPKVKAAKNSDPVTSFKVDTIKGKMSFSAKKVDLTGLSCPITINIQIGDYSTEMQVDENIVNGSKKPCPPELMR